MSEGGGVGPKRGFVFFGGGGCRGLEKKEGVSLLLTPNEATTNPGKNSSSSSSSSSSGRSKSKSRPSSSSRRSITFLRDK